jgi:osmoprotectant transport system ATP-binding protein
VIAFDGAAKRFAGKVAVAPTTFCVEARRAVSLVGPSGCGKSTILRLVLGLLTPDAGRVLVAGTPVTSKTVMKVRRATGYVGQEGGLFPHLTARDNVALLARRLGWTRERITSRVDELTALVRLDAAQLGRYPSELSGGQRQRVGLMRALMLGPEVLLLDEPMGALDPLVRGELQEDLRRIFLELGKTVLLVTHNLEEAAYLGDEVALMRAGHILQRGTMAELVESPADSFVRAFVAAPRALRA